MPRCGICYDDKEVLHRFCTTCVPDDDKRICAECQAHMMYMCPADSLCTALHAKCPYCASPLLQEEILLPAFTASPAFLTAAARLLRVQLHAVMQDRVRLYDCLLYTSPSPRD